MEEPIHHSFAKARLELAIRHQPSKDTIAMHRTMDQQRNPYNEPYANKAPRRSEAQITSDVCFAFADHADPAVRRNVYDLVERDVSKRSLHRRPQTEQVGGYYALQ